MGNGLNKPGENFVGTRVVPGWWILSESTPKHGYLCADTGPHGDAERTMRRD